MVHYRIHCGIRSEDVAEDVGTECADDATARLLTFAGMAPGDSREVWRDARCIGASIAAPSDARMASSESTRPRALLRIG